MSIHTSELVKNVKNKYDGFLKSIWLFPALLSFVLLALTTASVSGSSLGQYYKIFYGENSRDPSLIWGKPQGIRSDEWLVNTQKILAQSANDYNSMNKNIGNGENQRLINDVPTRDWSVFFRPHNLAFFVLPLDNAFAFRWFSMAVFLLLSCYFFALKLLPGKRMLASLISLSLLFSPFIQWWYAYGTLGSIYYMLFAMVIFNQIVNSKGFRSLAAWSTLLIYVLVCFAFVLYPPFQIPCLMVFLAYSIGTLLDHRKTIPKKQLIQKISFIAFSAFTVLLIVGIFVYNNLETILAVANSSYPGRRILLSGGYNLLHLFASDLSPLLQKQSFAKEYLYPGIGSTNQSEAANFMLLFPFLIIPCMVLYFKKKIKTSYTILSLFILLFIMLFWLVIPGLDFLGSITLFNRVGISRLLVGIGLLNTICIIYAIMLYSKTAYHFSKCTSLTYALLVFIFNLLINFAIMSTVPKFVNYSFAIILAVPFAFITYTFLIKKFVLTVFALLLFSLASTFYINPLYAGVNVAINNPVTLAMKQVDEKKDKKWISDSVVFENTASTIGLGSLSGVYTYPQVSLWEKDFGISKSSTYNRYAHVTFNLRDPKTVIGSPAISLKGPDSFDVFINPCDPVLPKNKVEYILTTNPLNTDVFKCIKLKRELQLASPTMLFIYKINSTY